VKASDFIVQFLSDNGSDKVFGYIGGSITHLYDSIDTNDSVEIINTINEQGAGFAAEGYARLTGKTGIAMATSGPGATNLITPIGSCFFDSIPVLFISGQVNTYEYKYDRAIRQIGFQESDIVSIVKPITKYAAMVDSADRLKYELEKAYFLTQHGRKGPVLLDIPMNIQREDFEPQNTASFYDSDEYKILKQSYEISKVNQVADLLGNSSRPILLIGGGSRLSDAEKIIYELLDKTNLPVVYSLMGKDVVKDSYKYNLGLIGAYGNRYGNLALANSDLVIVLGSRLDTRQTGTNLKTFAREAKIIHIDIDEQELNAKIKADIAISSDVKIFIQELVKKDFKLDIDEWLLKLLQYKNRFPSTISLNNKEKTPNYIVQIISELSHADDAICVDVGQHQMWVAQSFNTKGNQRVLFSGGMGSMGFALPSAIGVALDGCKRVIVIAGDGGFQMNIQELEIVKRRNLPLKIFIMNNANLGMVRQFQEIYFSKRYIGTLKDYSAPDFKKIGMAYGIKSKTIHKQKNIYAEIQKTLQNSEPEIIDIVLSDQMTTVEPKLIVGKPIEDMYPFLEREELKKLMIIKPIDENEQI